MVSHIHVLVFPDEFASIGAFVGILFAFLTTIIATDKLCAYLPKDAGREFAHDGKKSAGKPRGAGIIFVLAFVLASLLFVPIQAENIIYLVLIVICMMTGFLDDASKNPWGEYKKGFLDLCVAAMVAVTFLHYNSNVVELAMFDVEITIPPVLFALLTVVLVWASVNVTNCTDGVDGLCGSVTIPVMVFFTAAAAAMGRFDLALLPATLVGGLIAYLFYNWHPAKVFMGDTGSLFLGGIVCGMAFALDMPLILILVGIVYIVETLSVILQVGYFKLTHGKRLFKMSPIHHHFEMCGWKEEKIVLVFTAVSALMCLVAWFAVAGHIG